MSCITIILFRFHGSACFRTFLKSCFKKSICYFMKIIFSHQIVQHSTLIFLRTVIIAINFVSNKICSIHLKTLSLEIIFYRLLIIYICMWKNTHLPFNSISWKIEENFYCPFSKIFACT